MAPKNSFKKSFSTVSGKTIIMTVALVATVGFLLVSIGFSKVVDIDNAKVERIKTFLSTAKTIGNFVISNEKIRSIFNISLDTAQKGADISYGLLVLSAIDEFDLIDLVISQQYKQKARDYFNEVMDERMNIIEDARKAGYNFSKIAFSKLMAGNPMSVSMGALVWETIPIIDKSIAIFSTLNVVRQEMFYDGIWRYFDSRRGKESHSVAWEDAKAEMGLVLSGKRFIHGKDFAKEDESKLALQFAILWQKWGSYTDSFGITKKAREKFEQEMLVLVKEGSEKYALANKSSKISLLDKAKSFFDKITEEIARISDILRGLASQFSLKMTTGSVIDALFYQQTLIQNQALKTPAITEPAKAKTEPYQEQINDLNKQVDFSSGQKPISSVIPTSLVSPSPIQSPIPSQSPSPSPSITPSPRPTPSPSPNPSPSPKPQLCEKSQGNLPTKNKVILNEIAWMGSISSASDEWIELKNISGTEINLTDWQLLDKNQDIKIIFSKGAKLLFNGFFLLERTNDETVPGKIADLIYTGGLSNTDEALYLFDGNCQLQDEILANPNWLAGDNSSKRTMERKSDFSWQTSANPGGTPKSENSGGYYIYQNSSSGSSGSSQSLPPDTESPIANAGLDQTVIINESINFNASGSSDNIKIVSYKWDINAGGGLNWDNSDLTGEKPALTQGYSQSGIYTVTLQVLDKAGNKATDVLIITVVLSPKILISEIQINTTTSSNYDFIELYNPNPENIDIFGFQIKKRTSTGSESSVRVFPSGSIIPANDYFLWANSNYALSGLISSDATSTQTLAKNNSLAFFDKNGNLLDSLAWGSGTNPFLEGSPFSQNPNKDQSLGRKWIEGQGYQDADNNSSDFEIQFPTPKAKNEIFRDIIAPETSIDNNPFSLINLTEMVFIFSSNEENSTFDCKLDEENWQICFSPQQYSNLSNGLHTFQVRAKDISQNIDLTPAQYQWQIDTASPQTEILTHPPFLTNQNQANFIFSSNEENSTFECEINGSEWENCQSPKTFTDLPDGQYNFSVRAKDPASNIDSSPAQYAWTIDTTIANPSLSLTDLDSNSFLYANERRIKVTISHDEEAVDWLLSESGMAVENPDSSWQSERPSEFILPEGDGPKTVYLWTKDESENISPGISAQIILDTTPSSVQFNPLAQVQTSTGFNISWSGSDAISGILEYHLKFREESETGSESWQTISGQSYQISGLNGKTYYFKIRTKDNAGNLSEWSSEISTKIEQPILKVSPISLGFEAIEFGQNPANKNLVIENTGFGDLNWDIVSPEVEWLDVNLTFGQALSNVPVSVNISGLEAGLFQAIIKVSSNGGSKEIGVVLNLQEDTTPPAPPQILSPQNNQIFNIANVTLTGATEPNALILISSSEIRADEEGSWKLEIELQEGQNLIEVVAQDEAGNRSENATINFVLDTIPPETILDSFPSNLIKSQDASFGFSSNEANSTFECRLDNSAWDSCSSPKIYNNLQEGSHIFNVKAKDEAGNEDQSPASRTWVIDNQAPETAIDQKPDNPAYSTTATFIFSSNEANSTFECYLDNGVWAVCASAKTYQGLSVDSHYFEVRAIDEAGNTDQTPANYDWQIDNPPEPETILDSFPANPTESQEASFGFSSSEANSSFECSLDSGVWESCVSLKAYQNLNVGNHEFMVRASAAGMTDQTPAAYNWQINNALSKPSLNLSSYRINSLNFTVNWNSNSGQADHFDVQVKIGDNSWQDWLTDTSQINQSYSAMQDFTLYKFRVRSVSNSNYSDWQEIEAPIASLPVVINEVMYNPPNPYNDNYYEYIELYNPSPFDIDLQDWILVSDGSLNGSPQLLSADTTHSGSSTIIKAGGYAIIGDKTIGQTHIYDTLYYSIPAYSAEAIRLQISDADLGLPNSSSQGWVTLKDKQGNLIDRIAYLDWNLAQGNGKSLGKVNPLRFSNAKNNWEETTATPNQQNSNFFATASNYLSPNYQTSQDEIFSPSFGIYIIDNQLTVASNTKLIIKPGTIIKFKYSSIISNRGRFIVNGQVLAQGIQDQPIIFTSSRDTATDFTQPATGVYYGDWNYIEINSTSQDSVFDNIIVRYGGVAIDFMPEKGAFRILGADVTVKNSLFDNNRVAGIYLNDAGGSMLENLVLRNHVATYYFQGQDGRKSVGLWLGQTTLPTLKNLQFVNNTYGIFWPSSASCQALDDANLNLSFTPLDVKNKQCGQSDPW